MCKSDMFKSEGLIKSNKILLITFNKPYEDRNTTLHTPPRLRTRLQSRWVRRHQLTVSTLPIQSIQHQWQRYRLLRLHRLYRVLAYHWRLHRLCCRIRAQRTDMWPMSIRSILLRTGSMSNMRPVLPDLRLDQRRLFDLWEWQRIEWINMCQL